MKKEIVFIDEETLTQEELQNAGIRNQSDKRMKRYYDAMEEQYGETEE